MTKEPLTYQQSGVDTERQDVAMLSVREIAESTFAFRPDSVKLPIGYFANVIDMGSGFGLALSTDGVGTKILIAEMMDKYDTIGIDCVAMNANDVLCVGAEPVALLDYIAVQEANPALLQSLLLGLRAGAEIAQITIPGGEIAQVKEMITGAREGRSFDLVGTCVGRVPLERILYGQSIAAGDIIVGLRSTGAHSNGLTLARRVLLEKHGWHIDHYVHDLGRTIGEELLEPTRIYVREVMAMLHAEVRIKALAHITSTGFLNLSRAAAPMGYVLDELPEPPPIFKLIQHYGDISDEEMFFTYNMGIGFCVVAHPDDIATVHDIARRHSVESYTIGFAVPDTDKTVRIPSHRLSSRHGKFWRE